MRTSDIIKQQNVPYDYDDHKRHRKYRDDLLCAFHIAIEHIGISSRKH